TPRLSVADTVVGEGQDYVDFVVRLDAPTPATVSVTYSTAQQTAAAGFDFVSESGVLTFAPGEMEKVVRVTVINDVAAERIESLGFSLSGAVNAVIGNPDATATIIDNDAASAPPLVSVRDMVVDESSGEAVFNVVLNRPSTSMVTMN